MKNINALTIIGLLLNGFILLLTSTIERYQILVIPSIIALVFCVIGVILLTLNKIKIGSILFYIGSIPFIPLGIVGIMGVKKIISNIEEDEFNRKNYE